MIEMIEPINFDNRPEPAPLKYVTLFVLDGEEYQIAEKIRPAVGIKFLYDVKQEGETVAMANMLASVLGDKGMKALGNNDKMNQDDVKLITEMVRQLALGAMEQGNAS